MGEFFLHHKTHTREMILCLLLTKANFASIGIKTVKFLYLYIKTDSAKKRIAALTFFVISRCYSQLCTVKNVSQCIMLRRMIKCDGIILWMRYQGLVAAFRSQSFEW